MCDDRCMFKAPDERIIRMPYGVRIERLPQRTISQHLVSSPDATQRIWPYTLIQLVSTERGAEAQGLEVPFQLDITSMPQHNEISHTTSTQLSRSLQEEV